MHKPYEDNDLSGLIPLSRSIRINGQVTTIRLECAFWSILETMAAEERIKLSTLLSTIDRERDLSSNQLSNFSSLLRVSCIRYLEERRQMVPLTASFS